MKQLIQLLVLIVLAAAVWTAVFILRDHYLTLTGGGVTINNTNVVNVEQATAEPLPSATPWPTSTAEPTATATRQYDDPNFRSTGSIDGGKAYDSDDFDSAGSFGGGKG